MKPPTFSAISCGKSRLERLFFLLLKTFYSADVNGFSIDAISRCNGLPVMTATRRKSFACLASNFSSAQNPPRLQPCKSVMSQSKSTLPFSRILSSSGGATETMSSFVSFPATRRRQAVRNFQVTSETCSNLGPKSAGSKSLTPPEHHAI